MFGFKGNISPEDIMSAPQGIVATCSVMCTINNTWQCFLFFFCSQSIYPNGELCFCELLQERKWADVCFLQFQHALWCQTAGIWLNSRSPPGTQLDNSPQPHCQIFSNFLTHKSQSSTHPLELLHKIATYNLKSWEVGFDFILSVKQATFSNLTDVLFENKALPADGLADNSLRQLLLAFHP